MNASPKILTICGIPVKYKVRDDPDFEIKESDELHKQIIRDMQGGATSGRFRVNGCWGWWIFEKNASQKIDWTKNIGLEIEDKTDYAKNLRAMQVNHISEPQSKTRIIYTKLKSLQANIGDNKLLSEIIEDVSKMMDEDFAAQLVGFIREKQKQI